MQLAVIVFTWEFSITVVLRLPSKLILIKTNSRVVTKRIPEYYLERRNPKLSTVLIAGYASMASVTLDAHDKCNLP